MPYIFDQFESCETAEWTYWEKVFSPDECKRIISIGEALGMEQAKVGGISDGKGNLDLKTRNSFTSWLEWSNEVDWIFEALAERIQDHNNRFFGAHLSGFREPLQVTKYEQDGFYNWHKDNSCENPFRKISMVVNLSAPEEYEGGELEIFQGKVVSKNQGHMALFRSYEQHRVRKVKCGTRYSLVAWVHGPKYI